MDVFDLSARLKLDSTEYDSGLADSEAKGQSFGDKLKHGLGNAAKITTAAVAAVGTAAVAATGAMIKGAADVAAYGDSIDKASQKMGISAQAYQEWDAVLQHSGTSIDSLTRAFPTLSKQAEAGSEAFAKLGISQEQIANMSKEDLFGAVIAGLQEMEDGTERTVLAQELLGGSAKELGALLNTSAEDTQKMKDRVHELGGVLSDDAIKQSAAFQDNLQDLRTALDGAKRGIVSGLLPGLNDLISGFTSLIIGEEGAEEAISSGIDSLIKSVNKGIETAVGIMKILIPKLASSILTQLPVLVPSVIGIIEQIVGTIVDNLDLLVDAAFSILEALANSLINNLDSLIDAGIDLLMGIVTGIVENLPVLVTAAIQIVRSLVAAIVENFPEILEAGRQAIDQIVGGMDLSAGNVISKIGEILNNVISKILEFLPQALEKGIEFIENIGQGFLDDLPNIVESLSTILSNLVTTLMEKGPEFLKKGIELIGKLASGFLQALPTIAKAIWDILINVQKTIIQNFPAFVQKGIELLGQLITGIVQATSQAKESVRQTIANILTTIKNHFMSFDFASLGRNLINGVKNGIKNAASGLVNAAMDAVKNALNKVKSFLGIASPSKKARDEIGKMFSKGIGIGFEQGMPVDEMVGSVANAFDEIENMDVPVLEPEAEFGYNTAMKVIDDDKKPEAPTSITINVYATERQDEKEIARQVQRQFIIWENQRRAAYA